MDGYPYQVPLLDLQEMLNLSDIEEQDDWSSNPYSISNFFEPIVSPVKAVPHLHQNRTPPRGDQAVAGSSGSFQQHSSGVNPFATPNGHRRQSPRKQATSVGISHQLSSLVKSEPEVYTIEDDLDTDFLEGLEVFQESFENAELEKNPEASVFTVGEVFKNEQDHVKQAQSKQIDDSGKKRSEFCDGAEMGLDFPIIVPEKFKGEPKPRLEDVKSIQTKIETKQFLVKARKEQKRQQSIHQLECMIGCLKRYSEVLQGFLDKEGEIILEQYHANLMLKEIMPEMSDSASDPTASSSIDPFDFAHSVTKSVVDAAKGRTVLNTLPPRQAFLWRTSEILILQKSILESIVNRRIFLLDCRYTDLLTEMGFDDEDLQSLRNNSATKEMELGALKIILNNHEFFSKLQYSKKKPIQTTVIKKNTSGQPIVMVLPKPEQLVEDKWKALADIRKKTKLGNINDEDIDWLYVMKMLSIKNPKLRVDEDTCRLTYEHLISNKFNTSAWQMTELLKLREIREKYPGIPWSKVASSLNTNRSPFSCFVKYKQYCVENSGLEVPSHLLRYITEWHKECRGDAAKLDQKLMTGLKKYKAVRPKALLSLFSTTLNPRIRKGKVTAVEDALLFAVMERYKEFSQEMNDRLFDALAYALPWRRVTFWKMRFYHLVTTFYYKAWSLDDDKLLWNLVKEYGPKYKVIQRSFPCKDRKQCRSRYLHLCEVLKTTNLEDYHLIYNDRKENFQLKLLNRIARYLNVTLKTKLRGRRLRRIYEKDLEFLKMRRAPREKELESYIMSFPVSVLADTLNRLSELLIYISGKWTQISPNCAGKSGHEFANAIAGFDRRTFDLSCPISVASALHLRNAKLIKQEYIPDITSFELDVYKYHKCFSLRGKAKTVAKRNRIPSFDVLRRLCRLIDVLASKPGSLDNPSGMFFEVKSNYSESDVKADEEANTLLEQEAKRQEGAKPSRGKGKRKPTIKQIRRQAALKRWGKSKIARDEENSDDNTDIECSSSPRDGSSSMISIDSLDKINTKMNALPLGVNDCLKKLTVSIMSDHAYIIPMDSPEVLSLRPLSHLMSSQQTRSEYIWCGKKENSHEDSEF